jgi:hypothetical protein
MVKQDFKPFFASLGYVGAFVLVLAFLPFAWIHSKGCAWKDKLLPGKKVDDAAPAG